MLTPIQFNDEFGFVTIKINNIISDYLLAEEVPIF